MYAHRRNRHPQLSSPVGDSYPPSQSSSFFSNMPDPQNSHYEERQTFGDPQRDYLGYAAPRYDRDNDGDDHSPNATQSHTHWPPSPLYWETTQAARLPAHYLPSPWRDVRRAALRREREERMDTPFEILPSIENDERFPRIVPDSQWASDSSWTSPPTPASETFTSRSPSFSDDSDSVAELYHGRRHRNRAPDYVCSTPGSSPLTSPSLSPASADMDDRSATARAPTPPRRRQRVPSPSPPPSVPAHLTALLFRLSRQARNPHLRARALADPALHAMRLRIDDSAWQPQRCRCGECFCRNLLDRNGGVVLVDGGRFCAFCCENHYVF
ncbi:hypothetical protein BDP55DRAFT_712369 [Colletotrichum godetiae]|uniref:Uncharacterized protein n=1 Tax=Colletotrichum godetiae TaxID=1209918 RepID=A0AAJ0ATC3_9PEZI|nr:uncharacterized protein BDP55DRAFT_712369 [Colletotrichum godetiae]KAK1689999.1 hypothetical protein BDP55DRAFT_712369 [Colletotrichum godetiae]